MDNSSDPQVRLPANTHGAIQDIRASLLVAQVTAEADVMDLEGATALAIVLGSLEAELQSLQMAIAERVRDITGQNVHQLTREHLERGVVERTIPAAGDPFAVHTPNTYPHREEYPGARADEEFFHGEEPDLDDDFPMELEYDDQPGVNTAPILFDEDEHFRIR